MSKQGRITLITNRNVNPGRTDLSLFGDDLNTIHNADLNIATVEPGKKNKWKLKLLSNSENPNYENPASKILFEQIAEEAAKGNDKDWVFFIHGFNQSLRKNMKKCLELVSYGVNVIAFSWPSNPGPSAILKKAKEYNRAQFNARQSVSALDRTIDKLQEYLHQNPAGAHLNLNFVIHSLGNYLFREFVKTTDSLEYLKMFNNIILHEADVDHLEHREWVNQVTNYTKVYITINEDDFVLNYSDIINKPRLGNTAKNLNAEEAVYINFTGALGVGASHRPWKKPAKKHAAIKQFYKAVFKGRHGEKTKGWEYKSAENTYCPIQREPVVYDDTFSG